MLSVNEQIDRKFKIYFKINLSLLKIMSFLVTDKEWPITGQGYNYMSDRWTHQAEKNTGFVN